MFMLYIQLIPWLFLWYGLWQFLQTDYQWWEWLGTIISVGGITAAVGLPVAHELFHRHEAISRFFGDLFAVTLILGRCGTGTQERATTLKPRQAMTSIPHIEVNPCTPSSPGCSRFFILNPGTWKSSVLPIKAVSHWSPGNIVLWAGCRLTWHCFCFFVSVRESVCRDQCFAYLRHRTKYCLRFQLRATLRPDTRA